MSCVYLYSNCTCTHRGLKVRGIVPNHRKSPVCPNCFLFVSRDHQRSFLEDLAKLRADLLFWSDWWCSASSSVKRRQHTTSQNIDGKLDLQLTASLARGMGTHSEQTALVGIKFMQHVVCLYVCIMYMLIVHETRKMQPMHTKTNLDSAYSTLPRSSSTNVKTLHLP